MMRETDSGKLWGGRFRHAIDPEIDRFTSALAFDRRLVRHDLVGSLAHARMLLETGVVERAAAVEILNGLSRLLRQIEDGETEVEGPDEDVHSWIERRLIEAIGDAGLELHTARSRNDQTSLALRLFVREAMLELTAAATDLRGVWLEHASEHVESFLPGYTHLQRGQPVSLAHHLLAHVWFLGADATRLRRVHGLAGCSPLGAGALAGSPHGIDPARSAELVGFERASPNSMFAVADRDYVVEAVFACSLLMVHLSRWAAEVVLWSSSEFAFVRLEDAVAKGSSIMPQKKNPEPAELLRGKTGRVVGDLMSILVVLKGLPLTYNSDLQEDKEALFDALDTALGSLRAATALARGLHYDVEAMSQALEGAFVTATDLADALVGRGVPFRTAHRQSGDAVRAAESKGVELWQLSLDELLEHCPQADEAVYAALSPEASVRARTTLGGPAPERVREQLEQALGDLETSRDWLDLQPIVPIYRAHAEGRLTEADVG